LPFGTVKEFGEKYPLPNEEDNLYPPDASLTESDIRLLLTGAVVKNYKKGDIILAQGDANKRLYRIKSGTIILQKEVGGKQTIIARMGADATFGEMSVLDKQIISATVIADSDKVELYVMEVNGVYDLFKSRYALATSIYVHY
jgi:CRP-like cAMP-binding protein